jgi:hypothetical protein
MFHAAMGDWISLDTEAIMACCGTSLRTLEVALVVAIDAVS